MRAKQPRDVAGHASPERAALAAAIARYAESEATYAATVTAGERASEAVWEAQSQVTAATERLAEAKAAAVHHLVAVSAGTAGEPPVTIRQARDALADAEKGLEAARDARELLRVRLNELDTQRRWPKDNLQRAALEVVRVEAAETAARLAAEVDRLQRDLMRQGQSLMWLASKGIGLTDPAMPGAITRMNALTMHGGQPWTELRCEVPWQAIMVALMADAEATLALSGASAGT